MIAAEGRSRSKHHYVDWCRGVRRRACVLSHRRPDTRRAVRASPGENRADEPWEPQRVLDATDATSVVASSVSWTQTDGFWRTQTLGLTRGCSR